MRNRLVLLAALALALLIACSHVAQPALSPPPKAPVAAPSPTPPSAAEVVHALTAQADARPRVGGWPAAAFKWDWDVGIAIAREAVAVDDASAPAQLALGTALHQAGKSTEARAHLERAYAQSQQGLDAGYVYALALESLQELDPAKAILADLRARFPASTEGSRTAGGPPPTC